MSDVPTLEDRFEAQRPELHAVAYRLLGSSVEAEDAVQEAWLRLDRADTQAIENLGGWLRTVVARICLDVLRTRRSRPTESLDVRLLEPASTPEDGQDPQRLALLADSLGEALLITLDRLTPPERLAFVLHDAFGMPFDELAPIVERSPAAARQLASRARRKVRTLASETHDQSIRRRRVVEAFVAAAQEGDFASLLKLLDPDVELVLQGPGTMQVVRGGEQVANRASFGGRRGTTVTPALVGGAPAVLIGGDDGAPWAIMSFEIIGDRIVSIVFSRDPDQLASLV